MKHKIKVIIVDDHPIVREGLKQLLELGDEIEVIGEAESGLECLDLLEKLYPDIIFMDIRMRGISGIDTTRVISKKYPDVKVIILTIHDDDDYIVEAIKAGAKGFVLKKVTQSELMKIINDVMAHKAFLDSTIASRVLDHFKADGHTFEKIQLTRRELEVLNGVVNGLTDRRIADSLCISEHTVRSHFKNIFRKLNVSSRSQAAVKAVELKIIER